MPRLSNEFLIVLVGELDSLEIPELISSVEGMEQVHYSWGLYFA